MPPVSFLYKAIESVPVTLLMGLSACLGGRRAALEDTAFHSDSTYKPRGTKKTPGKSCDGET